MDATKHDALSASAPSQYVNRANLKVYDLISETDGVVSFKPEGGNTLAYLGRAEFDKRFRPYAALDVNISVETAIAIRDALIANDVSEAYHQLYQAVDPSFSRFEPWAAVEASIPVSPKPAQWDGYQARVAAAHHALFHDDPTDVPERLARFMEEANETCQAFGMSREDAHRLVDYTYDRPSGEPHKEIGAAMLTLTSLCVVAGYDLLSCAEKDLEKLQRPETIDRIRAKRSTRHGRGPLPGLDPSSRGTDPGTSGRRFLSAASLDVLQERDRQKSVEGWTPDHDDKHADNELSRAGASYAIGNVAYWPWSLAWWKPTDRRRDLVKAAALIIAEVERIDRVAARTENGQGETHV